MNNPQVNQEQRVVSDQELQMAVIELKARAPQIFQTLKDIKESFEPKIKGSDNPDLVLSTNMDQWKFPFAGHLWEVGCRNNKNSAMMGAVSNLLPCYVQGAGYGILFTVDLAVPVIVSLRLSGAVSKEQGQRINSDLKDYEETLIGLVKDIVTTPMRYAFPSEGKFKIKIVSSQFLENYTNGKGELLPEAQHLAINLMFFPDYKREDVSILTEQYQTCSTNLLRDLAKIRDEQDSTDAKVQ